VNDIVVEFRLGRLVWTLLVTFYFLVFFWNFFLDAVPVHVVLPLLFAYALVLWLAVEYYLGSPFFQSGIVRCSSLWRGVFAFFVYPFLGYVAADFIWWHWTQIPVPIVITGILGMVLFGIGIYIRLETLFAFAKLAAGRGRKGSRRSLPERKFVSLRFQRISRHPRYFATFVQLVGAALVFRSWGGLALVFGIGLPLILLQVRYEDQELRHVLRSEYNRYANQVPSFLPKFR